MEATFEQLAEAYKLMLSCWEEGEDLPNLFWGNVASATHVVLYLNAAALEGEK